MTKQGTGSNLQCYRYRVIIIHADALAANAARASACTLLSSAPGILQLRHDKGYMKLDASHAESSNQGVYTVITV